jgi:hypothetical protein
MEEIMIQIYLTNIHCNEETDEVGADEPYVLVTAVNLASTVTGFPAFEVVRYGPFEDVDKNETHFASGISQSFWSLTNNPATLTDPDKVIFVVALMENDNGDPEALRGIVKGVVGSSILGSLSFDRNNKVIQLINDVNSALGTPTGAPNFDDKVGYPQELRFSSEELIRAESGQTITKTLVFNGDGGSYTLTFEARVPVWQRFANLGGVFDGQPTSVSWGPGHLEVFIHGNDGAIWHKWWNNGWSRWESLGGDFPNGEISAISWGVGHIEVFVRGHDNAIWHKWWNNGWFGWESLGGSLASPPSAVTWGLGHIEVFARGFDNAIWHKWWNNGWFGWESLGGGLVGRPSAVSWGPGHIEVFAQAPDNAIWHKWWYNGWFGWESLGGGLASSPSAVTWGVGHIEVFAFTADGHVWHKWWNNGWFGWEDLGGVFDFNSQISPESWGVGHLEIFVKGNDNALWHKWWNNGWFGWESLGGDFSSSPNAISWGAGHLNVFVKDNSGTVWQTWWNNDHWGG